MNKIAARKSLPGPLRQVRWVVSRSAALALSLLASIAVPAQQRAPQPLLALDKNRHDFWEVFAGEDLSHVFWIRNLGVAPLELSERPILGSKPSKASLNVLSPRPRPAVMARGPLTPAPS